MKYPINRNKLIMFGCAVFFILSGTANAAALPDYSTQKQVLSIPQVTVDGQGSLYNVELLLDFASGRFSLQQISETPPDTVADIDAPFQLAFGQTTIVSVTGLHIQFSRIVEDSRCPASVVCIQAGQAKIGLTVRRNDGQPEEVILATGKTDTPAEQDTGGYRLALLAVEPYPQTTDPIPQTNYRITLRVTSLSR